MTDTDKLKNMISGLEGKTMSSRLWPLMPEIDRKIKEGVPRGEIYKLITQQGIKISEGTFYTYIYRYRKSNSKNPKPEKSQNQKNTPLDQDGNLDQTSKPKQLQASPSLDDMLTNEKSREEFTNQFMQSRPIRRKKT